MFDLQDLRVDTPDFAGTPKHDSYHPFAFYHHFKRLVVVALASNSHILDPRHPPILCYRWLRELCPVQDSGRDMEPFDQEHGSQCE